MTATLVEAAAGWIGVLGAQSLHVSVIFVFVLLASRLLRRRGPAVHLALWGLVFVRLLLPPDLSHPWSHGALIGRLDGPSMVVGADGAEAMGNDVVAGGVPLGTREGRLAAVRESDVLAAIWLLGCIATVALRGRRVAPFHAVAGAAARRRCEMAWKTRMTPHCG